MLGEAYRSGPSLPTLTSLMEESLSIINVSHYFSCIKSTKVKHGVPGELTFLTCHLSVRLMTCVSSSHFRWKADRHQSCRGGASLPISPFPSSTPCLEFVFTTQSKCSSFNLFPVLSLFLGVLKLMPSNPLPLRCLAWRNVELEEKPYGWFSSFSFQIKKDEGKEGTHPQSHRN